MEQPQACSPISRSYMAASVAKANHLQDGAGVGASRQALSTAVQAAEMSSQQLHSASASHRGAAASLLDQSELHGGFRCKNGKPLAGWCRCVVLVVSTLHPHCQQRQGRARTLTPPPPRTVEQPQACLISRGYLAASAAKESNHMQDKGPAGETVGETSTHLDSASASHRGAAASLLNQSELQSWRLYCDGNYCGL